MLRKLALAFLFVSLGSLTALAADLNGKWTANIETPRGTQAVTFDFHVDGDKLTGTITSPRGTSDVKDGKIDGDSLSFNQAVSFNGNDFTISYIGKVDGDSIKFTRTMGDRPAVEFTATRAKDAKE
jgi:hypothetical protein